MQQLKNLNNYGLLVDLDGTIIQNNEFISLRVKKSIKKLSGHIPVSIVTGRGPQDVLKFSKQLNLFGPQYCETALAFSIADSIMMQKNSIFTPLSPEEAAKIKLGDSRKVKEISNMMRFTSEDCLKLGIIDRIIDEPNEGSHQNHLESAKLMQEGILEELSLIKDVYPKNISKKKVK